MIAKKLASFLRNLIFSERVKYLLRKYDLVVQKYDLCKQNSLFAPKHYLHTYILCLYMLTYFI